MQANYGSQELPGGGEWKREGKSHAVTLEWKSDKYLQL